MSRRWVKVLAIAVVVVAVLFTLVDRVAVHYADKEVAQLAKEKYGYGNTTDGHLDLAIKGFPFLTQVAGGTFITSRWTRAGSTSPTRPTRGVVICTSNASTSI